MAAVPRQLRLLPASSGPGIAIAASQNRGYNDSSAIMTVAPGYYGGGPAYYGGGYGPYYGGGYGYRSGVPRVNGHPLASW